MINAWDDKNYFDSEELVKHEDILDDIKERSEEFIKKIMPSENGYEIKDLQLAYIAGAIRQKSVDSKQSNVFIVRVEETEGPNTKCRVEECYASRTDAVAAMKKYFEKEKKNWLKERSWATEEDFTYPLSSDGGWISYGFGGKYIRFELKRLKVREKV